MGYVYFLFEHKSYRSLKVALQLLTYMVEIWKRSDEDQLPLIIPLVIAHGRSRWNTSTQFSDLVQGYDQLDSKVKQYIPNYEYILFDLTTYSNADVKGNVQLRILMEVFRDIFKANTAELFKTLERSVEALQELEDKDTRTAYFQTLINYIFNVKKNLSQAEVKQFSKRIEHIYPEGSKMIMSLREEILKEGKQEGRQEGRLLQNQEDIHYFLEENIREEAEDLYKKVTSIQDTERLGQLKRKLYRTSSKAEIRKMIIEGSQ